MGTLGYCSMLAWKEMPMATETLSFEAKSNSHVDILLSLLCDCGQLLYCRQTEPRGTLFLKSKWRDVTYDCYKYLNRDLDCLH